MLPLYCVVPPTPVDVTATTCGCPSYVTVVLLIAGAVAFILFTEFTVYVSVTSSKFAVSVGMNFTVIVVACVVAATPLYLISVAVFFVAVKLLVPVAPSPDRIVVA